METIWNENDMCFFEFKLSVIKDVRDGKVKEVTDGYFEASTGRDFNDRCFPVNITQKLIADDYSYWDKELHNKALPCINFPDIHGWLIGHWAETASKENVGKDYYSKRHRELRCFAEEILDETNTIKNKKLKSGILLIRP